MIEISQTQRKREEKTKIKTKKRTSPVMREKVTFDSEFKANLARAYEGSIEELLVDLKEQEGRFLEYQNLYEMEKYKALVQKILKSILDEGFETKTLKRSRKDRADFTIISHINEKLAEIARTITVQNKAFDLMKTIEDIRGLIFDLIH